jgi:hypothetical protein
MTRTTYVLSSLDEVEGSFIQTEEMRKIAMFNLAAGEFADEQG